MIKFKEKTITAGVDEVGRGCLAGPVVSAAVILKKNVNLKLLKDSKKISFKKREEICKHIKKNAYYAIGTASVEEILSLNILQASLLIITLTPNFLIAWIVAKTSSDINKFFAFEIPLARDEINSHLILMLLSPGIEIFLLKLIIFFLKITLFGI